MEKPVPVPETVYIEVAVACLQENDIPVPPEYATATLTSDDPLRVKVAALIAEIRQRQQVEDELLAIVTACASLATE